MKTVFTKSHRTRHSLRGHRHFTGKIGLRAKSLDDDSVLVGEGVIDKSPVCASIPNIGMWAVAFF
jgi:hypothetical protein